MATRPIYEALAEAFVAEGIKTHFVLLGDGNMHWGTAMQLGQGVETIHLRHEHCTIAAAMGYASATGEVGVASVTCGPGFTQTMTGLVSAARSKVPLVLFAGETPLNARWHPQTVDQSALASACGVPYIACHSPARLHDDVRQAFYIARFRRTPVVLGIPCDLQQQAMPDIGPYSPSREVLPHHPPLVPDTDQIEEIAALLSAARNPVLVAGRGALRSGAAREIEELADFSGAFLSTTLPVRGMFDHSPHSLGICGGYADAAAAEIFSQSELVITFGASHSHYSLAGGKLFGQATIVQVGPEPLGLNHGLKSADIYLKADAKLAALALTDAMERQGADWRATALKRREEAGAQARALIDEPHFALQPDTLDPRTVFAALETVIPKTYDIVSGSGHHAYFHTQMRGYAPDRYHAMREFGAIGNALSHTIGVAAARGNGRVVLFEGDGSLLMHIQELEAIRRHGLKLLIVCSNDGAYGAEIHKLRADNIPDQCAIFGRPDFASIAKGFGLDGATVTNVDQFARLMEAFESGDRAMVWDVHVSDTVTNPLMRASTKGGHASH